MEVKSLQKKALKSCAAIMIVLGVTIMIIGFIFEFHGDFSKIADARPSNIYHVMYPHTQYWLGLPLFLSALYVLMTSFYSLTILHIVGSILSGFLMVASICAVGLQSSLWYIALDLANIVNSAHCTDAYDALGSNPRCNCYRQLHFSDTDDLHDDETLLSLMSCSETKNFPAIVTAMVILCASAYLVCQATCFVYVAKILGSLKYSAQEDESIFHETTSQQVLLNDQAI